MPDLGKYAAEVLLAYGVSLFILIGIVVLSWRQSQRTKRDLDAAEAQRNG
jgi:heme exporter protein D